MLAACAGAVLGVHAQAARIVAFDHDTVGAPPFARTARVATAAGARTSLYVPEQKRLYLAGPHRGAQKTAIRAYDVRD